MLDYVNRYYPDILPEDVLRHYGYTARPDGVIGENALYSLKEEGDSSIFEDNEELNDAAESLQEMLRYVSAENNELRSAFNIKTVRSSDTNGVAKAAAYLRKQYDSHYKKSYLVDELTGTHKFRQLRVGAAISSPYNRSERSPKKLLSGPQVADPTRY